MNIFLKHLVRFKRHVYLDHNATTKVSRHVRRKMNYILKYCYGNPSSLYKIAQKSAKILEEARQQVAKTINADSHEIMFTGCATESNNTVLKSVSNHFYPEKKKIISTPIEHLSIMNTLKFLENQGIQVGYCPVDDKGRVYLEELEKMIDGDTFLICCMLANNELGTIQDIPAITQLAKQHGVLVLSDCVQALGKISIDVHGWGLDYASFSAHKLHGPKGIGALYVKQSSPFSPFIHGGHQEDGMRAGTESLHNIAGFGAACQDVKKLLAHVDQIRALKQKFIDQIRKMKPDCVINSPEDHCLPNTINIRFPGVSNAALMAMLDYNGIAVSAGSACSSQEDTPSHVLKAIGLSDQAAQESIRVSLSSEISERDIRYAVKTMQAYFEGHQAFVHIITPAQLNERILFDENTYILDVRPQFLRKKYKGLPNSHEVPFGSMKKYMGQIPKEKHIVIVCQGGYLSYIVAYYLVSKGFGYVSSLQGGIRGWKARHKDLYQKYAGKNIMVLQAEEKYLSENSSKIM